MLETSPQPLDAVHDLIMFDLDGVVYVSGKAIQDVPQHIERLREEGHPIAFVTNNAARTPQKVAERLTRLGVAAEPSDVVTSAQAAAHLLAERFGQGAHVVALGGEGLRAALAEAGLVPVETDHSGTPAVAVASGYGPDVRWRDIMRAALLVKQGLPYVASNADMTIPTVDGLAPGHGVLVQTISTFAGVSPQVAGKPQRPLMDETVRRVAGSRPLMVGDRLDTDIEGAYAIGIPSLLVLTGVTWLGELVAAPPAQRPTYISVGTSGLFEAHSAPQELGNVAALGGWRATTQSGRLQVAGEGDAADWWRVAAVASWRHLDATGHVVDIDGLVPPGPPRVGADG